jgi:hypothetical protein
MTLRLAKYSLSTLNANDQNFEVMVILTWYNGLKNLKRCRKHSKKTPLPERSLLKSKLVT